MHNIFPNFGFFLLSDNVRMFFRESVREFGYFVKFMWSCDGFAILNPARERGIRLQKAKILASQRDKIGVWKIFKGIVVALLRKIGIIIHHVIDVATLSMFDQLSKGKMEVDSDLEFCMYLRIFSSWCPKMIFMTMMTIVMIMVNLLLCGQKRKKGEGKGSLPRDPYTLFDPAVAAAVTGDHDDDGCRRGSFCSREGRVYKRNWTEWLNQWVGHH